VSVDAEVVLPMPWTWQPEARHFRLCFRSVKVDPHVSLLLGVLYGHADHMALGVELHENILAQVTRIDNRRFAEGDEKRVCVWEVAEGARSIKPPP
jgi:hypothetical protein